MVYGVTHNPTGMIYIGVARRDPPITNDMFVFGVPLGDAILLFSKALPKLMPHDDFTIRILDTADDFFAAADLARQIIVRLKEHMPGKVINPSDKETRAAVDTGIKLAGGTLRAKAKSVNIAYTTVYQRMRRGWTEEQALGLVPPPERVPGGGRAKRMIEIGGVTKAYSQWCKEAGITIEVALARENRLGWPIEKALTTRLQRGKKL